MSAVSTYQKSKSVNHVYGGEAFAVPASITFRVWSTLPNADFTGGVEISAGGYAPVTLSNNTTNFPHTDTGTKTNGVDIIFCSSATENWPNRPLGFTTEDESGNLLDVVSGTGLYYVLTGYGFVVLAGDYTIIRG